MMIIACSSLVDAPHLLGRDAEAVSSSLRVLDTSCSGAHGHDMCPRGISGIHVLSKARCLGEVHARPRCSNVAQNHAMLTLVRRLPSDHLYNPQLRWIMMQTIHRVNIPWGGFWDLRFAEKTFICNTNLRSARSNGLTAVTLHRSFRDHTMPKLTRRSACS